MPDKPILEGLLETLANDLGKAFDAAPKVEATTAVQPTPTQSVLTGLQGSQAILAIELEKLEPNPFQPRKALNEATLTELMQSIYASGGLLQEIGVRRMDGGKFQIIFGHRRAAAYERLRDLQPSEAERAKYATIPAREFFNVSDAQMLQMAMVENSQRENLTDVELAEALNRRAELQTPHLTYEELGDLTGLNKQRVYRLLRLSAAPMFIKESCSTGETVEFTDDEGNQQREVRRLDLYSAIEFIRAHEALAKLSPTDAEAKIKSWIRKGLEEGWSHHQVSEFLLDKVSAPPSDLSQPQETSEIKSKRPPFSRKGDHLNIDLSRLDELDASECRKLAKLLQDVVASLLSRGNQ